MRFQVNIDAMQVRTVGVTTPQELANLTTLTGNGKLPKLQHTPMMLARRLSLGTRQAVDLGAELLKDPAIKYAIYDSRYGELAHNAKMLQAIAQVQDVSPTDFTVSVHNAALANASIISHRHIPGNSIAAGEKSLSAALTEAITSLLLHKATTPAQTTATSLNEANSSTLANQAALAQPTNAPTPAPAAHTANTDNAVPQVHATDSTHANAANAADNVAATEAKVTESKAQVTAATVETEATNAANQVHDKLSVVTSGTQAEVTVGADLYKVLVVDFENAIPELFKPLVAPDYPSLDYAVALVLSDATLLSDVNKTNEAKAATSGITQTHGMNPEETASTVLSQSSQVQTPEQAAQLEQSQQLEQFEESELPKQPELPKQSKLTEQTKPADHFTQPMEATTTVSTPGWGRWEFCFVPQPAAPSAALVTSKSAQSMDESLYEALTTFPALSFVWHIARGERTFSLPAGPDAHWQLTAL